MKTSHIILSALLAGCVTMATTPRANASGGTGNDHGFFWSLYYSGGSASISFPQAGQYPGNYAINWSGVQDVVGGKGWNPGWPLSVRRYPSTVKGASRFLRK